MELLHMMACEMSYGYAIKHRNQTNLDYRKAEDHLQSRHGFCNK